ncbi:MAG: dihydrofolate reductase family protein, partial [Blastocatellia bacterium]|nr:dihydrofolate reductase family protein [Blastocatellia bacterium]
KEFFHLDLVDEIRLTIAPILLGGGLPFFDSIGCQRALHLKEVVAYKNGMVALWYKVIKPEPDCKQQKEKQ